MNLRIAGIAIAAVFAAGSAQAAMVAGWDFSAFGGEAFMDTDSSFVYKDTLESNYSDLDQSSGAGRGNVASGSPCPASLDSSCQYGTAYWNGDFGSTALGEDPAGSINGAFTPASGSLLANKAAPGTIDFDNFTILTSEGQLYGSSPGLRMTYTGAGTASVVFEIDLTSSGPYTDWQLTLAANTEFGGTSLVGVDFATTLAGLDPVYAAAGVLALDATDTLFTLDLDGAGLTTDRAFVRLNFDPGSGTGGQPTIDDVAVFATLVPEPATGTLLTIGLLGLGISGRRRRA